MAEASDAPRPTPQVSDAVLSDVLANFSTLNKAGNGRLTLAEFREGLGMLGMDNDLTSILFNSFDRNGDGVVDCDEFVASMCVMLHPEELEQQVGLAFNAYDLNKDGMLTKAELTRVIRAMFMSMQQMGIEDQTTDPESYADELFRQLDRDGKGFVTKPDYLHLATTNPDAIKKLGLDGTRYTPAGGPGRRKSFAYHNEQKRGGESRRRSRVLKRGKTVTFGHENWEQVTQMMIGIRLATGHAMAEARRAAAATPASHQVAAGTLSLTPPMFEETWKTEIPTASKKGRSGSIAFKDYAPQVFRRIRANFGVTDREYMLSLGPEQILGELLLGTCAAAAPHRTRAGAPPRSHHASPPRTLPSTWGPGRRRAHTAPRQAGLALGALLRGQVGLLLLLFERRQLSDQDDPSPRDALVAPAAARLLRVRRVAAVHAAAALHGRAPPRAAGEAEGPLYCHDQRFCDGASLPGARQWAWRGATERERRSESVTARVTLGRRATRGACSPQHRAIHERYDLKGSTQGRTAGAARIERYPETVRKDLDLKAPFRLKPSAREAIR